IALRFAQLRTGYPHRARNRETRVALRQTFPHTTSASRFGSPAHSPATGSILDLRTSSSVRDGTWAEAPGIVGIFLLARQSLPRAHRAQSSDRPTSDRSPQPP